MLASGNRLYPPPTKISFCHRTSPQQTLQSYKTTLLFYSTSASSIPIVEKRKSKTASLRKKIKKHIWRSDMHKASTYYLPYNMKKSSEFC